MNSTAQKRIRRGSIIIYITLLLAVFQSVFLEIVTSDYGHEIFSFYFAMEASILGLMVVLGLRNKWMRFFLVVLTACETLIFLQDRPISPDEILMLLIFGLRLSVIAELFGATVNGYYRTGRRGRKNISCDGHN